MSSLAHAAPAPQVLVTDEDRRLVNQQILEQNPNATDLHVALYLRDCERLGLHPLDKLIVFTLRKSTKTIIDNRGNERETTTINYAPITSIDLFRSRAADTGEYAGSDDAIFTGTPGRDDFKATVTVYRIVQGVRCPFTATARWKEYNANNRMWRAMPHGQLAKCAEALALRKGFPRELGRLYIREEMDQAGNDETGEGGGRSTRRRVRQPEEVSAESVTMPSGAAASVATDSTAGHATAAPASTAPASSSDREPWADPEGFWCGFVKEGVEGLYSKTFKPQQNGGKAQQRHYYIVFEGDDRAFHTYDAEIAKLAQRLRRESKPIALLIKRNEKFSAWDVTEAKPAVVATGAGTPAHAQAEDEDHEGSTLTPSELPPPRGDGGLFDDDEDKLGGALG